MQAYRDSQSILQKQIRLMKLPFRGLSYHTSGTPITIFTSCPRIPQQLAPTPTLSVLHSLPKSHNNSLLIVAIKLLQLAYEDPSQLLLRKIKQVAYDSDVILSAFEQASVADLEDQALRKLFVEFFHLVACDKQPNRVEVSFGKYQIMRRAFVMLMRSILHALGVTMREGAEPALHLIIQAVFKHFKVSFEEEHEGVFRFDDGHILAEDNVFVYKTSPSEQPTEQDSNLLSSESSLNESQPKLPPTPSEITIIKRLEKIDQEEDQQECDTFRSPKSDILETTEFKIQLPVSQVKPTLNLKTPRTDRPHLKDVTPDKARADQKTYSKSPVSINKPNATHSNNKSTRKVGGCRPKNLTFADCRVKTFNTNNYSFGIGVVQEKPKVKVAPLKQMFGCVPNRQRIETVPSFRNLMNKML